MSDQNIISMEEAVELTAQMIEKMPVEALVQELETRGKNPRDNLSATFQDITRTAALLNAQTFQQVEDEQRKMPAVHKGDFTNTPTVLAAIEEATKRFEAMPIQEFMQEEMGSVESNAVALTMQEMYATLNCVEEEYIKNHIRETILNDFADYPDLRALLAESWTPPEAVAKVAQSA